MHMRKFAALNIFISFAICLPVFANSDNWTYSPPGSYEQAISISKETGEIKSHLYLGKIKFCEVDDEFFYFSSDFLKFSVPDRKSTRLNSSHSQISYAVFCLKK